MRKTIIAGVVLMLALSGFLLGGAFSFLMMPATESDQSVVFEVEPGQNFKAIARRLEEQHLVRSAFKFELLARITGLSGRARVGEYALRKNMRPKELLLLFASGKSIEHLITFQEGINKWDMAEIFAKQKLGVADDFLNAVQDKELVEELLGERLPSLEGYLFPETYKVTKYTGARGLVKMMVGRFMEVYAQLSAEAEVKMSRHQIATLASIIEKETGAPEERTLVSSVFSNRLRIGMKLQTDPTIIYGILDSGAPYNGNITRKDLLTPNRYNTYTISGLPYGPIGNAGREALYATLHPAKSEFLYFVSRNDGTHVFSKSFGDHNKAVAKFQLDPKAREGKSWRDLEKKKTK